MVKLVILFRAGTTAAADVEKYNEFLMGVDHLPGLRKKAVNVVYSGPGGFRPFERMVELYFDDRSALETALTSPVGVETGNQLHHFAGPDALSLFVDVLEEEYVDTDSADA